MENYLKIYPPENPWPFPRLNGIWTNSLSKRNIFEGTILDIAEKERDHLIYFQTMEGKVSFEISIPNYAFRNLHLSIGKIIKIALWDESLWVMV